MQGQANHFTRYAPEKIEYGINRYQNETRRLYRVMDAQLAKNEYLVGDRPTIADFSCWGWVAAHGKLFLFFFFFLNDFWMCTTCHSC
ncbi:glutathione S-transferase C-terminal domain-containing protein [Escherichia coli]|nr:glutathione S-transferase C-terminal domain-containing protein [Escherichia coli]